MSNVKDKAIQIIKKNKTGKNLSQLIATFGLILVLLFLALTWITLDSGIRPHLTLLIILYAIVGSLVYSFLKKGSSIEAHSDIISHTLDSLRGNDSKETLKENENYLMSISKNYYNQDYLSLTGILIAFILFFILMISVIYYYYDITTVLVNVLPLIPIVPAFIYILKSMYNNLRNKELARYLLSLIESE